MSGFEVAGVVLGTLPLVISGLEAYRNFLTGWNKAPSELKSLHRLLSTEQAKLYNVCNQLLSDVVPLHDIEPMLRSPFGPLWQSAETNAKIRRRLWDSYEPFEETVTEVAEALQSVAVRLRIQVTRDGQVEWINKGKMNREFKKFLYRLERKDYQDAFDIISRGVSNLESLARMSVASEPTRQKQSRGKLFTVLRDLSTSIYRALCASILCTETHDISLELATRLIDHGGEDKKIWRDAHFKVAISSETGNGPTKKRFWDEVSIKTVVPINTALPSPQPTVTMSKTKKQVAFAATSFFGGFASDIKTAMPLFTKAATDVAFISATHGTAVPTKPTPLNLCMALKHGRLTRPACYGHLVDDGCLKARQFQVLPPQKLHDDSDWSIVTLQDVLERQRGLRPLVLLAEKVRLALAIASSVLQLSKTPWIPGSLTRKSVHFFRRSDGLSYEHPFLLRSIPEKGLRPLETSTSGEHDNMLAINPTLLSLGILLLEIILGSTLDQLRDPNDGDDLGVIGDICTVSRLLEQRVALINPTYKTVIERCIGCRESRSLEEDDFRQEVYNKVVMELETILEHTKLGW